MLRTPLLAVLTDINGKLLESAASAQKDWAEFVHRRIKEDVTASRQLMRCQSLSEMHQLYSQNFQTAFDQYQNQSEKVVQRGESMAQHLTETTEAEAKEDARARH